MCVSVTHAEVSGRSIVIIVIANVEQLCTNNTISHTHTHTHTHSPHTHTHTLMHIHRIFSNQLDHRYTALALQSLRST